MDVFVDGGAVHIDVHRFGSLNHQGPWLHDRQKTHDAFLHDVE